MIDSHCLSFISEVSLAESFSLASDVGSSEDNSTAAGDKWAVTKLVGHKYQMSQISTLGNSCDSLPAVRAKMAAEELQRRCPAMPLPKLHCFTSMLDDESPDANKIISQIEAMMSKHESRKKVVKKVRRMYHLSQSNAATTRRIMENSENGFDFLHSPDVSQLIAAGHFRNKSRLAPLDVVSTSANITQQPTCVIPRSTVALNSQILPCQGVVADIDNSTKSSSDHNYICDQTYSARVVPPLSFDDLTEKNKTVKTKIKSNMWINYAS